MPQYEELYSRLGVSFASRSGNEASGPCPFHKDDTPSFSANMDSGLFKCHAAGCGEGGDFRKFAELALERLGRALTVPSAIVSEAHARLLADGEMMNWLLVERGLTRQTAIEYELGLELDRSRLWIPVKVAGKYLNVRRHKIDKSSKAPKSLPYAEGYGTVRLWPYEPKGSEVWICEGELDCMVLRQMGLDAVTGTGGAGTWKEEWNEKFKGKEVFVVYDLDQAGRAGAKCVTDAIGPATKSCKIVTLTFNGAPGKDVTDYIIGTRKNLKDLRNNGASDAKLEEADSGSIDKVRSLTLSEARKQENVGFKVQIPVIVAGKDLAPFAVPKTIEYTCKGGLKICPACAIFQKGGRMKAELKVDDPRLLTLININTDQQRLATRKIVGIEPTCPRFDWKPETYYNIEEVKILPDIDKVEDTTGKYVISQAFAIGAPPEANQSYEAEGMVVPHPQTQYVTFVFPKMTPKRHVLENYRPSKETLESLKEFQAGEGLGLDKLRDIADDLTANVTKIHKREDIILAFDLCIHSMLSFKFQGKDLTRGWVQGLVVGDTRTGKSDTGEFLSKHYRAGTRVTSENTSYAGLVGGLQQTNKRWMITWGALPLSDRKFLLLDEMSGLPVEDIERMSGIRSSGIAEITKIQTEKTYARVRMLCLSNPRGKLPVGAHGSGIDVIRHLVGKPEDIARFDFAQVVASGDVPLDLVNSTMPHRPHRYTSELCHELVLWCWSRKHSQVIFEDAATQACLDNAVLFSNKFSSDLPIVEPNEQRVKFARLAAAVAGRLFSTEDGENLIVKKEHVEIAANLLEKWFCNQNFSYHFYSGTKIKQLDFPEGLKEQVKDVILPQGYNFCEWLLNASRARISDLEDQTGLDRVGVKLLIHKLYALGAIKRAGQDYVKTPGFIRLLKEIKPEEVKEKEEIPF